MKYTNLLILLALIAVTESCENSENDKIVRKVTCIQNGYYDYLDSYRMNSICTTDLCMEYLKIWEELFIERNSINKSFFDNHIIIGNSYIYEWAQGVSFRVGYKFEMDWGIAYNEDQFIIKINQDNNHYTTEIPRDKGNHSDNIITISKENLLFPTIEDALNNLIDIAKVNTLCIRRIYLDENTGNLILEANGEYENEDNSCIFGSIDLINGETEVYDGACWIFN